MTVLNEMWLKLDISIIDDGNEQNSDLKQSKQFLANSV